ncbi:MAG: class I SAM-dependent methyltransferase [Candidatus Thorarchaeota archaeon]
MIKNHVKKNRGKQQSNLDFKMMAFIFSIRDKFNKPIDVLKKTKINSGSYVLDYGCGPGSYSIASAELVGLSGKVFAADMHPLAIKKVNKKAAKKGLNNIITIQTDCNTNLEKKSIDVVFCFDTFHSLNHPEDNLSEFQRILKDDGILYIMDHHLTDDEVILGITDINLFKFLEKKEDLYKFIKSSKGGLFSNNTKDEF